MQKAPEYDACNDASKNRFRCQADLPGIYQSPAHLPESGKSAGQPPHLPEKLSKSGRSGRCPADLVVSGRSA